MQQQPDPQYMALQEALAGRYSLERQLGKGGMGIVYLAREVALDRPVALKLLRPELAGHEAVRGRFLREARTAANLSHPNIVPIFAVDEVAPFVFFAMGFVDGETLGQRIHTRGPMAPSEATRVLREVAWALTYAHAQGVIHRDVKPDNIFLERGSGRTLVMDFGIAHLSGVPSDTGAGEILGTAEYMSPEQASGEAVSPASDIYSLGIVGYYALSGKLPFTGVSVRQVLVQHITKEPPRMATAAPDAPRRLTSVIDRCLAKEAGDRFADGHALADALGAAVVARQETPVALRVFLNNNRQIENIAAGSGLLFLIAAPPFIFGLLDQSLAWTVFFAGFAGALAVPPVTAILWRVRKMLQAGFGRDAVVQALEADVARRDEELAFQYGSKASFVERWLRRIALAGGAVGAASIGLGLLLPPLPILSTLAWTGSIVGVVSGLSSEHYRYRRQDLQGRRWLKIWKGRIGRWLFRVGGAGLHELPPPAPAERATELAIGMAADHLFDELPAALRHSLGDVPAVIRRLERDAQAMRKEVEELEALLAASAHAPGASVPATVSGRRDSLIADLERLRDQAQAKMADAVAALETIRLNLLRLHGGVGDVQSITQDLSAALAISDDIEHLVQGRASVQRLLEGDPTPAGDPPPTS